MRLRILALTFAVAIAPALAYGDDDALDRARQLGQEGGQAWERGEWEAARQLFHRARELYPGAPTLGVREGRCLVKLGRLREAALVFARTAALPIDKAPEVDPEVFAQAKRDAAAELDAIKPRIPHLLVRVEGNATNVALMLDGASMERTVLGTEQELDPGLHTVAGTADGAPIDTITITLAEGERRAVTIPTSVQREPPRARGVAQRILGVATLGVGAVGLGLGVGLGVAATDKHGALAAACPGGACPGALQGDIDGFRSLRSASTVAYVAGAVLLAGGAALVLFAPSGKTSSALRVSPWIGVASAGFGGTFR